MKETLDIVMSMYDSYNGTGMQTALFFASLLYLYFQKKENEKRFLFLGYSIVFFAICFFPVTAKVIMKACIGEAVYWRMFWLLPSAIVIAYAAAHVIMRSDGKAKRHILLFAMLLIIAMTGTNVYNGAVFDRKQNNYKLPQDTIDICDMIERDAAANGIGHKKLITTNELLPSIRQYDADILMPYGYNQVYREHGSNMRNAARIFKIMGSTDKNWDALAWHAAMEECNYLAYPADPAVSEALASCGYEKIGENASYCVYRRDTGAGAYDGRWLITQYGASAGGDQLMFYTLQDNKGHLIVVDGGWTADAEYVRSVIKSLGRHVDAWFITHPHQDHAGAFVEIYKNLGKIKIDKVYAVDMASPEVCKEKAPWDETVVYDEWLKLDIAQLNFVHAGDTVDVAGLSVEIFNAYDEYVYDLSNDLLNDGSMMFKVTANEESMLFCADVGKRMSDYLLDTWGDSLKADYIQMGHHGNGGLKSDFYKSVGAKGAFFDAPEWLMHDTSGRYTTMKNAHLMSSNGAAVYSFSTVPNQIILN